MAVEGTNAASFDSARTCSSSWNFPAPHIRHRKRRNVADPPPAHAPCSGFGGAGTVVSDWLGDAGYGNAGLCPATAMVGRDRSDRSRCRCSWSISPHRARARPRRKRKSTRSPDYRSNSGSASLESVVSVTTSRVQQTTLKQSKHSTCLASRCGANDPPNDWFSGRLSPAQKFRSLRCSVVKGENAVAER